MKPRWDFLGLLLWPLTGFTIAWYHAPSGGTPLFAALGGLLGCLAATRLEKLTLRLPSLWAIALMLIGVGATARHLALYSELPTRLLGPDRLVLWTQNLGWLATVTLLTCVLRFGSARYRSLGILEGSVAGLTFVSLFAAHRQGYINRPFFLVDPLWSRGIDPMPIFLALGGAVAVLVAFLSLSHHRGRRSWTDLLGLMALIALIFLAIPTAQIKNIQEKLNHDSKGDKPKDKPKSGKSGNGTPKDGKDGKENDKDPSGKDKNDEPSFSDTQPKKENPPVAVVVFRDTYQPEAGYYYFRQSANSQYNGIKLVHSNDDFDADLPQRFPIEGNTTEGETVGMKLPALDEGAFKSLRTRVALMTQHSKPFGLSNPNRFWSEQNPDPKRFQKAYEVESKVLTLPYRQMIGRQGGEPSWDAQTWEHYLNGPKDPRYAKLLTEILEGVDPQYRKEPFYKAVAIKLWLDEHTTYSLRSPYSDSADPVGDYLFGERIGYCVFTSHSACYLYRCAGIPSRIADGYAVNAQQRASGSSLLLRSNQSHSWPEIYLQGLGWIALDVAPKKNLEPPSEQVDQGLQQMLGDMAREDKEHGKADKPQKSIDLQELVKQLFWGLVYGFPWALLVVLSVLYSAKLYRRYCPWLPWVSADGLSVVAYRSLLDSLADRGHVREEGLSREEFARALGAECPGLMSLTLLNLRAKLGGQTGDSAAYLRSLREARAQLQSLPRSRWHWLRLLHPASWWNVR